MKKNICMLLLALVSVFSFGQEVLKDDHELHIGIGIGNALLPYQFTVKIPPVQVSYGYAIADNFVVSGTIAYANTYYEYNKYLYSVWPVIEGRDVKYHWTTNHFIFGIEGRYYLADVLDLTSSNFNPYGKVLLGYNFVSVKKEEIQNHISGLDAGITPYPTSSTFAGIVIGTNYSFNDQVAVFAELGYAINILQLGVNIRM